jgi:hypothetical protein
LEVKNKGGVRFKTLIPPWPLQNTNGSGGGDCYIKRRRLGERPLQEKGGGDDGGRYRERAAVIGGRYRKRAAAISAAVTGSGRYPYRKPSPEAAVTGGRYRKRAAAMAAVVT